MKTKRTAEDLSAKRLLRRTLPAAFVLLAVVLAFTAPAAAAEDTSWYTGHESDPTFTLTTADQLAGLASLVNSGNTFEGKTVELGGDITISGDWTPIGNATTTPFSGTFDGNGKTITFSLSVSGIESTDPAKPYGLFGANSGTIQNLGVAGSVTIASGYNVYFGSIAGYNLAGGVITDCFSSCNVSLTIDGYNLNPYVGGIVGQNEGTLENSYAVGDVIVTVPGSAYAGGIVGYNHNTIFNCYAAGNVTVTNESLVGIGTAGGIAGCHSAKSKIGNITNCFALNEKITAVNVGRIAGWEINAPYGASPILSGNSAWDGMTLNDAMVADGTAADKNGAGVAHETVWNNQSTWETSGFDFTTVWEMGTAEDFKLPVLQIFQKAEPTPEPEPESYFSGGKGTVESPYEIASPSDLKNLSTLVNAATGTYNTSHYKLTAPVTLENDWTPIGNATTTPFSGTFDGNGHVVSLSVTVDETGVLASIPYGLFGANSGTIQNLGVAGSVTIEYGENVYFGSIAGYNQGDGVITDCFSSCDVSLTIDGFSLYPNVGGIVGQNEGTLKNSYAVGDVLVTVPGSAYAGGIVGYNHNTIFNCYAAGNVTVINESSVGIGTAGGIAGCHSAKSKIGNITNCFALNEKITAANVGRIAGWEINTSWGTPPKLSGNSAWDGMTLNDATVADGTADNKNGADVASDAVWGNTFEPFTDANGWQLNEGNDNFQLPVLKNIAVPADIDASHLNPAVIPTPEPTPESYFSGGEGTEESPYEIASLSDLKNLSTLVNSATGTYNTSHYKLTAPVTLGSDWTPIGNATGKAFSGTFDGNDQTITFYNVVIENYADSFYGVFGVVGENGEVTNLNVAGSLTTSSLNEYDVGGIAGDNYGTITNSQSSVAVTVTGSEVFAGSIAGYNTGIISGCSATGAVTAQGTAYSYAGGIVGENDGTISGCSATGAVEAKSSNADAYAGGIVGCNNCAGISNIYAAGNVTAESSGTYSYAGGIAGYSIDGTISNSYATGIISSSKATQHYAGGIAGSMVRGSISNSYALSKEITANINNMGRVTGYVGSAILSSNYAWNGMTLNGNVANTDKAHTEKNGADVASAAVWGILFEPFTDANGWKLNAGNENFQLPVLQDLPAPANADASHLKEAAPTYTITFDANGGTGTEIAPITGVGHGGYFIFPDNTFTRTGYTFDGWYNQSDTVYQEGEDMNEPVTSDLTFYAKWKANTSTVQFNANGGTGEMTAQTFTYDVKQALTANGFTRTGYTFAGWAATADGVKVYDDGQEVSNLASENGAVVTLYAKWTINQYTITFNVDGGSEITPITGDYGTAVTAPANPTKTGYTFAGWDKEIPAAMPAEDVTITAQWTANTYTVKFNANEGSGEMADQTFTYDVEQALTENGFTRTGYEFAGWAETENGAIVYNNGAEVSNLTVEDGAVVTLYAKWTANTYPVTWVDGQGGTLQTDSAKYGEAFPAAPADPTRDGYTFNGWSTTPATMPAEPVTITAQWTAIEYSVKYYDGTSEYTELAATLNYNQRPVKPADQAKHGHDFAGWYADAAFNTLYDFTVGITADTTIYAKFTPKSYTITWVDGQGGTLQTDSVKYGEAFPTAPAVTPRHGYAHNGWSPSAPANVEGDLTLTAQWTPWTYTVKFFANDGTDTNTTQEITYGTNTFLSANTFTNGEKKFLGWATESTATAALYADKIAADGLVTANGETISLYAVWGDAVAPTHTVTFQIDGTPYLTTPVLDGVKVDEPAAPTKEGHTFAGWCTDEAGTASYNFEAPVTTDLTLYANWTVNTYTVTFDANGGTVTPADAEVAYNTPVSAPVAEKAGYTLEGWYASEDFSGTAWDFSVNPVTGTLTLYANWTQIPAAVYTVTFHANNGTTPDIYETASVTAGNTVSAPANNPVWEGHTFAGWFKDVGGTEAYNFADGVTANLDLYANWTVSAGTHKVTFNSNGGSGVAEQHIADGGKVSKPADPQKTGYTFNGWFKEAALTNAWNFDTDTVTAEITLYAKWTENSVTPSPGAGGGGGTPAPSTPSTPSTPTTPTTPEVPDTPKVTDETKEIPTAPENIETLPTGDKVVVVALENTEVIQSVAVPEAVAQANPEASVKVTEGGNAPALPENVAADDVHIVVGVSIVDKEGNPVKITESGYFILDADVPAGKKLVVGHYKNDIWVDCLVEDLGNGHYKVHYNGLSPFAAVIIEEHEESPFAAEEKPTEKPAETPAPILGMVLGGLAAAVVLRRK